MPSSWQDEENETNRILRENLENAVRQLTIEQKIVDAFRNDEEVSSNDETVDKKQGVSETSNDVDNRGEDERIEEGENPPEDETIEPAEEEVGHSIEVTELSAQEYAEAIDNDVQPAEGVETANNAGETANGDDSNQDDGGTDAGDAE